MKYLIIGRTGAGKDYFANALEDRGLKLVKSYATRPKRHENEDTHIFITQEEANAITDKIAVTVINGYEYFATATQVNESDVYILDPRGLYVLMNNMPNTEFQVVYVTSVNNDKRKSMAINRSNDANKESVVFDKRAQDEDEQFTDFEEKIYQVLHNKVNISEMFAPNITDIHLIENDYNPYVANNYIEKLMENFRVENL